MIGGRFPQQLTEDEMQTRMAELCAMLRPAGGGIHTVSTGRAEQEALQHALYAARDAREIDERWREQLARVPQARVAVLGIPSDCGAGLVRGAAYGPQGIRRAVLALQPRFADLARDAGVVDVGDVLTVPH